MAAFSNLPIGDSSSLLQRPDGRWFLRPSDEDACRIDDLVAHAGTRATSLYLTADARDKMLLTRSEIAGFREVIRHDRLSIPLASIPAPPATSDIDLVRANRVPPTALRHLDNTIRQLVPGTDGWAWDPADFDDELGSEAFDPATYLVARPARSSELVGLVRVWMNSDGPRLGCIGVLPHFRRTRVTATLLLTVAGELRRRDDRTISTEIATHNVAARRLADRFGASVTGQFITLRWDAPGAGPP